MDLPFILTKVPILANEVFAFHGRGIIQSESLVWESPVTLQHV